MRAEEKARIVLKVSLYFRPLRIAPYPPMESPPIMVSSRLQDRLNMPRVTSISSLPRNSPARMPVSGLSIQNRLPPSGMITAMPYCAASISMGLFFSQSLRAPL